MKLVYTAFLTLLSTALLAQVEALPIMNQYHSGHTCSVAESGTVLVAGGWDGSQVSGFSETLEIGVSEWEVTAPMNDARIYHTAHTIFDGRVIVFGGWDGNLTNLATTEIYMPVIDEWEAGPSLATGRSNHRSVALQDGRILIAGGYDGNEDIASCEIYHPAFGTIEPAASMNVARSSFAMVVMEDGRVLVSGGFNPMQGFQLLSCEIYDPELDTWTTTGNMDFQRDNHAGYLLDDGQVLVTGGREYNGDLNLFQAVTTAEIFNPEMDSWQTLSLPYGVNYHQIHEISGAGVVTLGGADQTGDGVTITYNQSIFYDNQFQSFSPAPEEWEDEGRYRYASCALGDGTVVVTGGDDAEVGTAVRLGLVDQINETADLSFQIFPNPAIDRVLLITEYSNPKWQLMNLSGQVLETGMGTVIEVSELAGGNYLIRVITPHGEVTKQLQVQR